MLGQIDDTGPSSWLTAVAAGFAGGSVLALVWMLLGAARAYWLYHRSREAPPYLRQLLAQVVGGSAREPDLRLSHSVGQPVAMGALRPAILLPLPQVEHVAPRQLEAVLAHEWAHIRRGDLWLLAVTRALLVLFFAHPLYWWLRSRIRQDQETIADAAAIREGSALDYAATLLTWLRLGAEQHAAALAFGGRPSQMKRRIAMLVSPDWRVETRCSRRVLCGIGALAALGVLTLSLLTLRPAGTANAEEPGQPSAEGALAPALDAQEQKPIAEKRRHEHVLTGQVVDSHDKAIAGATVCLMAYPKKGPKKAERLALVTADNDGRFRLTATSSTVLSPDELVAIATAKGHGPGWTAAGPGELKIALADEQIIRGRLIDLQGQPAAGVKVHVSRVGTRPTHDGTYRAMIAPGLEEEPESGTVPPSLLETRVMVSMGQQKLMINGGTKPAAGRALPAVVFAESVVTRPLWPQPVISDAQGYFTIRGVGRGQGVGLQIHDERFALQVLDVPAEKTSSSEVILLAVAPARTLEGTVVEADRGKPIPHARLQVNPPNPLGGFVVSFVGLEQGNADWKGRQGLGTGGGTYYALALEGGAALEELPSLEIRADENGRYRANLPLGDSPTINVRGPDDQPFLKRAVSVNWRKGAARQTLDIPLSRGVLVQGKVTEQTSGQPVADARVDFWSKGLELPEGVQPPRTVRTDKDGAFQALLPPAVWYVLVNGATSDYVCQKISADKLTSAAPSANIEIVLQPVGGKEEKAERPSEPRFYYPDAWQELDLSSKPTGVNVSLKLQRAVIKGRLVRPDGTPVKKATMYFQHPTPEAAAGSMRPGTLHGYFSTEVTFDWSKEGAVSQPRSRSASGAPGQRLELRDGQFEIALRDRDTPYRLFFLDEGYGAVAELVGNKVGKDQITVTLAPCGAARVRFVDEKGAPIVRHRPLLWALLTGAKADTADFRFDFSSDLHSDHAVWLGHIDPRQHNEEFRTAANGELVIRNLIPGVSYRIWSGKSWEEFNIVNEDCWRDFRIESNQTLELPALTLKREKIKSKEPTE
jgi:hypothetical protein